MNLELLQQRGEAVKNADAILKKARAENRDLSHAEEVAFEAAMQKVAAIDAGVEDEHQLGDMIDRAVEDRDLSRIQDRLKKPLYPPMRPSGLYGDDERRGGEVLARSDKARTFRAMFPDIPRDDGGFRDFGEWWNAFVSGRHDPRLTNVKNMIAGTGVDGGFAVPTRHTEQLFDAIVEESVLLSRVQMEALDAIKIHAPAWKDLDQSSGGLFGGFKAVWQGEDHENTEQDAALRMIELDAKALRLYTSLTRELAFFSRPSMTQELMNALRTTVAHGIDVAFMTGDGVGKPWGVLESPSVIDYNRATASNVTWEDVSGMVGRLHSGALADAIWIANPDVLPKLMQMEDSEGHLLWQGTAVEGQPDRLAGKPVFYRDRLPALGSRGDLTILSPSHYIGAMGPQIWLDVSEGPGWYKDRTALRAVVFADGKPQWDTVYTPPNGNTKSWAVTLDVPAGD